MRKSTLLLAAMLLMVIGTLNTSAMENYDFQDLCMAIGKGGPWAVNDGGDAGFAVNGKTMHYLGDYTEQGFTWNQRFAYEYADGRGKLTFYNKNNKKNQNCGLFSWDYNHYLSVLDLKDGDKVTITVLAGSVTFASETAEGVTIGDDVTSDQTYTISTVEGTTRLDILMSSSCLISKIVIEPNGVETIPVINVSKKTLNLIPGASTKLSYTVVPSNMPIQWKSDNEDVASVDNDGVVTAHATGVANITCYWKSTFSDATASDVCVVSVANVNLSYHPLAKSYDFTIMGNVTLRLGFDSPGMIWNEANSRMVGVFFCDNTGLEQLAVQAAAADSSGKGWLIVNGQGLTLGTGAGRCAAIAGIRKGQIVEFIYTGDYFYTHSDDDGIEKTALDEESGCAIYIANEDGMIGFEIDRGCSVKQINIYDPLPEVYTEFVESMGTLTYYNDGKREERTGITELYDPVGNPDAVRFTGYYNKVVKAVIDPSMKDAKLTSMNGMFYGGFNIGSFTLQGLTKMTAI